MVTCTVYFIFPSCLHLHNSNVSSKRAGIWVYSLLHPWPCACCLPLDRYSIVCVELANEWKWWVMGRKVSNAKEGSTCSPGTGGGERPFTAIILYLLHFESCESNSCLKQLKFKRKTNKQKKSM